MEKRSRNMLIIIIISLHQQYNLQTDMARRQLEYEAQQVQGAMTDKLGSAEQSSQRQEARLRRIRSIEADMMQLQRQQHLIQRVQREGDARGGGYREIQGRGRQRELGGTMLQRE